MKLFLNSLRKLSTLTTICTTMLFFFSCKKNVDNLKFESVETQDAFLRDIGVSNYQYSIEKSGSLVVSYKDSQKSNISNVKVVADTTKLTTTYSYNDSDLSFDLKVDEYKNVVTFTSSEGDHKSFLIKPGAAIDEQTGKSMDPIWYSKLKVDEKLMFQMMAIVTELQIKKAYINSIATVKDKKSKELLKINTSKNPLAKIVSESMAQNECSTICMSTQKYGPSRIIACESATLDLPARCSNQYCIGNCSFLGCDCLSLLGDYLAACTARGKSCGPPVLPPVQPS